MRKQVGFFAMTIVGLAALAATTGVLSAAPQAARVAVIDNARVFEESRQGQAATQQIQANVDTWQQQLNTVDAELQRLAAQRQQQGNIMTPDALRALDRDIEQKQIDRQRLRDDAQRQATTIQNEILAALETQLTPVVEALAREGGYAMVFNSASPGLLYFDPAADITDALIARLNAMDR